MKQKESLEYHAVINFVSEYNQTHKRQFTFLHLCNPPMPDALCDLNGREIGIEVVHSYGTKIEAAIRLGNRKTADFSKEEHLARRIIPINKRSLNSLIRLLSKKAGKHYSFSPVWLIIRNAFPLWEKNDYKQYKKEICIPENHPFRQIWLLCDKNSVGPSGIIRLA